MAGVDDTKAISPYTLNYVLDAAPNASTEVPYLTADGVETALVLNGSSGCYASTPHHSDFASLSYLWISARVRATDYSAAAGQIIVAKEGTASTRSFRFWLNTSGAPNFTRSTDGSAISAVSRTNPGFVDGEWYWLAVEWRLSDGRVRFLWAPDSPLEPVDAWAQIGADQTLTGAIHDNSSPIEIGSRLLGASDRFTGQVKQVVIRTSAGGTPVAAPNFAVGTAATRRDVTGKTWTMNGAATSATPAKVINRIGGDVYILPNPDFDIANGTGTDLTAVFQLAIDACPNFGRVIVPPSYTNGFAYAVGELTIDKPMTFMGLHRWGSRIVSYPGTTGYLLNLEVGNLTQISHTYDMIVQDLNFCGRQRQDDCGAVRLSIVDRVVMERVEMHDFQREALNFERGVRECEFRSVYAFWCGSYGTYPMLNFSDIGGGTSDNHNMLDFQGCKFIYPFGVCAKFAPVDSTNPTRTIRFSQCTFHGLVDDHLTAHHTIDGYQPAVVGTELGSPLIDIADARDIFFSECRFHSPGYGQASILIRQGDAGAGTFNRVFFTGCGFGECQQVTLTGVTSAASSDAFASTDHHLGTGACVQVDGAGLTPSTDYWVIRVDDDTFQVATSLANALAGTETALTDDTGIDVTTQQVHIDLHDGAIGVAGSNFPISTNRANIVNRTGSPDNVSEAANQSTGTLVEP